MPNKDKPVPNPQILFREEFDDWSILFDPDQGSAVGLNPVGAFVWKLLDGERTESDILDAIKETFDEVSDEAAEHLAEFMDDLARRGFVGYSVKEV